MIKKTILIIFLSILILSCGRKGDPEYKTYNFKKSFRKAYQITASVVNYAEKNKIKLNELSLKELQKIEPSLKSNVLNIFDLKSSVNSKKSFGGTSFNNIKKMIVKYNKIYK